MIENLSHYWDKADGKTKKKILGCIFAEKFENFDFESCIHIKALQKKKKPSIIDGLSMMAPPINQSCSTSQSFSELVCC